MILVFLKYAQWYSDQTMRIGRLIVISEGKLSEGKSFLNLRNMHLAFDRRTYFMIHLHERMLVGPGVYILC